MSAETKGVHSLWLQRWGLAVTSSLYFSRKRIQFACTMEVAGKVLTPKPPLPKTKRYSLVV
jgi:hypothetical protein